MSSSGLGWKNLVIEHHSALPSGTSEHQFILRGHTSSNTLLFTHRIDGLWAGSGFCRRSGPRTGYQPAPGASGHLRSICGLFNEAFEKRGAARRFVQPTLCGSIGLRAHCAAVLFWREQAKSAGPQMGATGSSNGSLRLGLSTRPANRRRWRPGVDQAETFADALSGIDRIFLSTGYTVAMIHLPSM
jgi:hypothetical protein